MKLNRIAALLFALGATAAHAADLFPLQDVRLGASPFLDAQTTDLNYLMAMEPDRLLAPFLREAGLAPKQPSFGNWESSVVDGHMGGLRSFSSVIALHANLEPKRFEFTMPTSIPSPREIRGGEQGFSC